MGTVETPKIGGQADPESERNLGKEWQGHFPYHYDADELVSRRELLHFAVYASGTLFLGTALLAVLGRFRGTRSYEARQIAKLNEVPVGQAVYFHYPAPQDQAVLIHLEDGRFAAYNQTCTHLSCSVFYQKDRKRLFCPCHEGAFDPRTGEPIAGPPVRPLGKINLNVENGTLYAIGVEP